MNSDDEQKYRQIIVTIALRLAKTMYPKVSGATIISVATQIVQSEYERVGLPFKPTVQ